MKTPSLLICLIACFTALMAQEETVVLKPGESLHDFKVKHVYKFPEFVPSRIIYKDGAVAQGKMNYNHLSMKIEFIGPTGDTLNLIDNEQFKEVILAKSIFRQNNGFYELLRETPAVTLVTRRPLRLLGQKKIGAMGLSRSGMGTDSYSSVQDFSGLRKITPNVEHVFSFTPVYYIGSAGNSFVLATLKNFQNMVPDKKDAISAYAKEKQVNFGDLEDVSGLLTYVQSLQK